MVVVIGWDGVCSRSRIRRGSGGVWEVLQKEQVSVWHS